MRFSRRHFVTGSAALLATHALRAQIAHIDVGAEEGPRILATAQTLLATKPTSIRDLSVATATLTAAFILTKEQRYPDRAQAHLLTLTKSRIGDDTPITDLVPIAEAAVALRFLVDILPQEDLDAIQAWLSSLQDLLNTGKQKMLERDRHDHRASCWLLLSAAIARVQRDGKRLEDARARFRRPTLRNQIRSDGGFPEEQATPNPFRNTLFNFDLLCGCCQVLASQFDLLWDFELPDGPGMRIVAAALYPMIADPAKWTGIADAQHFRELPGRRPGLLFAGRAYNRPEYVDLWKSLPTAIPTDIAETFPIREPLLWTTRAQHGL